MRRKCFSADADGTCSGTYEVTGGQTTLSAMRFRPFTDGTFFMHTGTQRKMSAELMGARRRSRGEKLPLLDCEGPCRAFP